jgi:hypothetical protein
MVVSEVGYRVNVKLGRTFMEIESVKDGIIDEKKWSLAFPRILFLLKESTKRSGWTQIAGVPIDTRKGDNPRFWRNILLWKHAVCETVATGFVPEYPELGNIKENRQQNNGLLDEIAYVNVNKVLGDTKSNNRCISQIALVNSASLSLQIDEIAPQIVFCCYTLPAYRNIYHCDPLEKIGTRIYRHRTRVVIDFYHPSNRRGYHDLYDDLATSLGQEVFTKQFPINPST